MSPVGDPSGHWPAERLSGALAPHKPDRLVELCEPAVSDGFKEDGLAADPLAEPKPDELPSESKGPDPRKSPEEDPTEGKRSIKAIREDWCSKKSRQVRYRRSLEPTSARIPPKQYLFSRLWLP